MGGVAVGDLRDVAEAGLVEVSHQRLDEALTCFPLHLLRAASHADPGIHEGAGEIRPDRSLVIRAVPLARAAAVARDVAGLSRRKAA